MEWLSQSALITDGPKVQLATRKADNSCNCNMICRLFVYHKHEETFSTFIKPSSTEIPPAGHPGGSGPRMHIQSIMWSSYKRSCGSPESLLGLLLGSPGNRRIPGKGFPSKRCEVVGKDMNDLNKCHGEGISAFTQIPR